MPSTNTAKAITTCHWRQRSYIWVCRSRAMPTKKPNATQAINPVMMPQLSPVARSEVAKLGSQCCPRAPHKLYKNGCTSSITAAVRANNWWACMSQSLPSVHDNGLKRPNSTNSTITAAKPVMAKPLEMSSNRGRASQPSHWAKVWLRASGSNSSTL